MSAAIKKPAPNPELSLVALLARYLVDPSPRFEDAPTQARSAMKVGMRCLAALDIPTRLSLEAARAETAPAEPTPAAAAPQATAAASVPVPAPQAAPPAPRYGTRRPEYKQGLEDHSVVDALLEFHRRKRPMSSSRAPSSEFRPDRSTQVAAVPKSEPRITYQRPGTTRVFRSRGE